MMIDDAIMTAAGVSKDPMLACRDRGTGVAAGGLNAPAQGPLWSPELPLVLKQRRPTPL
jgi:hypothetical protein